MHLIGCSAKVPGIEMEETQSDALTVGLCLVKLLQKGSDSVSLQSSCCHPLPI